MVLASTLNSFCLEARAALVLRFYTKLLLFRRPRPRTTASTLNAFCLESAALGMVLDYHKPPASMGGGPVRTIHAYLQVGWGDGSGANSIPSLGNYP